MALKLFTPGVEQYLDGGSANIKMMVIGGPGAGKTRMSSFWPRPIYADCEGGLASIADRGRYATAAEVKNSKDMLDLLSWLKTLERTPKYDRQFQTVIVDTLDAYQRKVKDEWLQKNNAEAFRGFEAWGYLETRMSMLMTRLLNLDYNVIVLAHYKDKMVTEGEGRDKVERHELTLQLQGEIKDTSFNDFDLVGWLGTYWAAEDGQRVEKRGLTFKRTPDKPFLKDRFFVTPPWMPINFDEGDYTRLFEAWNSRLDDLDESVDLGEVPDAEAERPPRDDVVVGPLKGGALPPAPKPQPAPVAAQAPSPDVPLDQLSKPDLIRLAQSEGLTDIKLSWNKREIVEAIRALRDAPAVLADTEATADPPETPAVPDAIAASTPEALAPDQPMTVEQVAEALNANVVEERETPAPVAAAEPARPTRHCAECGKELPSTGDEAQLVRLSYIKFRKYLCGEHYAAAKKTA